MQSNILGDYDPTSMSAHFPPDLETIPGFENDLFPFSSLGQVGSQATSGGGGGGTEAASSSFGGCGNVYIMMDRPRSLSLSINHTRIV